MKKSLIILLGTLLCIFNGKAQDSSFLPLDELLKSVETNFPEVLIYKNKEQAWAAKAEGAKAFMPPVFSVGFNRFPYTFSGLNEMSPMNQASIMLSLEQMITHPKKLYSRKEYYQALGIVEVQKGEWTKNELKTIAKKLYYQRLISERKVALLKDNEELLKLLISTAQDRYTYNQTELTSIYKADAKLQELKNMQLMEESMIEESSIGINTFLQRNVNTLFIIDTSLSLKNNTQVLDSLSRSDIKAMKSAVESMKKEQNYMRAFSKPDFGIQLQHMQMLGMPEQFSVMGMITIPIVPWSSKMYKSDVRSMSFDIQVMQEEIESMKLMAIRMQAEKFSMLQYSIKQLNIYRTGITPSFEKNMEVNLLAFRQNTGSFFILLDAWEMLLMKKLEMYDLWMKTLTLEADYEQEIEKK